MKKIHYFIILYLIFLVVLVIALCKIYSPKELGEVYRNIYEPLDYSMEKIETNMKEITTNNDWNELKNINANDMQLISTYNSLLQDVKTCYLAAKDLLEYRYKVNITENELRELNNKENCLENFEQYNFLILSNSSNLSEKIKKQISIMVDYKEETNKHKKYDVLIYDESIKMSKVASISQWLKVQYDSQKDK